MKGFTLFGFDVLLLGSTLLLMTIGVLFIYSSGISSSGIVFSNEYLKQLIWVTSGIAIMVFILFVNYSAFRDISPYIYGFLLLLLLFVLFFGKEINGARSWIGLPDLGIQPSEFAKIGTILFFATYLNTIGNKVEKLRYFLLGFLIITVPVFLILLQPDLGTSLVYFPIFIAMILVAGGKIRHVVFVCGSMFLIVLFVILPYIEMYLFNQEFPLWFFLKDLSVMWILYTFLLCLILLSITGLRLFKSKIFYWFIYSFSFLLLSLFLSYLILQAVENQGIKEYQIKRIITFLNPQVDKQGSAWNINQSITAIGSGGIFGKGFLMGTQSHYQYLPQQSTDFIFSIIAEELGFAGGALVISLFAIILIRGIKIASNSYDRYGMLVGTGIIGMIFFHAVINIGMAMGIMPITGIPLFFLSYGGSSLWTALVGIGILINISVRRYRYS